MKKFFGLFLLVLLVIAFNSAFGQANKMAIGVVDVEIIVKELPEAQQADKDLKDLQKNFADTLKKLEDEFYKKLDQYQKQKALMTSEQQQKEEENLQLFQQEILSKRENFNNELLKQREKKLEPIRVKVKDAIEAVAKDEKLSIVFDKSSSLILFVEDQFDITYRVLDKIKRKK